MLLAVVYGTMPAPISRLSGDTSLYYRTYKTFRKLDLLPSSNEGEKRLLPWVPWPFPYMYSPIHHLLLTLSLDLTASESVAK
jgi:hypothetical protein